MTDDEIELAGGVDFHLYVFDAVCLLILMALAGVVSLFALAGLVFCILKLYGVL